MIWYIAFTGAFLIYQLDVIVYSLIALFAVIWERLVPVPGHPAYERRHPSQLVYPPQQGPARASDGKDLSQKQTSKIVADVQGSWTIAARSGPGSDVGSDTIHQHSSSSTSSGSSSNTPPLPGSPLAPGAAAAATLKASGAEVQDEVSELPASGPIETALTGANLRMRTRSISTGGAGAPEVSSSSGRPSVTSGTTPRAKHSLAAAAAANKALGRRVSGGGSCGVRTVHQAVETATLLPQSLVVRYEKLEVYPLVLVQLPMYNEEAHCEVVIERACRMEWPKDRVIIQVCDDSTRDDIKKRIDAKVASMAAAGHNCMVMRRPANVGYKAGNMINGMKALDCVPWEFVAVFDADFEMPADFLYQTIWHMVEDQKLAFVQTRWTFTNGYDNLLCWAQKVCLSYHFSVEQRSRSFMRTFFGFNGTGGVWRRTAMEAAGGWNMESTVEDMDLSIRTYLQGWKFRYLDWVHCPNELPPTLSAYKTQQFRWNSGPMVVLKQMLSHIWTTDKVNFLDRLSCSYFFFRFIYSAFLTVVCLACPAIVIWLDPWQWKWPNMAFLISGNTASLVFVWLVGPLFWPYFLFQTGVGYFRVYAMCSGLMGSKKSKGWKVTKKFGKGKLGGRVYHKPYTLELLMAVYYLGMTFAACWWRLWLLGSFTWIMTFTFLCFSIGDYLF